MAKANEIIVAALIGPASVVGAVLATGALMGFVKFFWSRYGDCGNYLIFYVAPLSLIVSAVLVRRVVRKGEC